MSAIGEGGFQNQGVEGGQGEPGPAVKEQVAG